MSDQQQDMDPFSVWRDWYQQNERQWNEQLSQVMGDERFAESAGRMFKEALQGHRMFTESMGQWLANLNLPARSDVLAIGDRIGEIEDSLAALQVEIRALRSELKASAGSESKPTPARPSRTRKPQGS